MQHMTSHAIPASKVLGCNQPGATPTSTQWCVQQTTTAVSMTWQLHNHHRLPFTTKGIRIPIINLTQRTQAQVRQMAMATMHTRLIVSMTTRLIPGTGIVCQFVLQQVLPLCTSLQRAIIMPTTAWPPMVRATSIMPLPPMAGTTPITPWRQPATLQTLTTPWLRPPTHNLYQRRSMKWIHFFFPVPLPISWKLLQKP